MKTIKFLNYATFVLFLGLAISSCEGPEGPAGPAGTDGTDGNANVISSDWFAATWTVPSTSAAFTHTAPEITQDVLDTGVIMVYMKTSGHVYALPISFMGDSNPKEYNFWADPGSVRIWFTAESSYSPSSSKRFRYVIIPSNNDQSRTTNPKQAVYDELANAGIHINDYYAVCAYYGINPK